MVGASENSGRNEVSDRPTDEEKQAWSRVLDDMHDFAGERQNNGWTTVEVQSGNTTPEPPNAGETGRSGVTHVVPSDAAERLADIFPVAEVDEFDVHRRIIESTFFSLTEFRDTKQHYDILVAGAYDAADARPLVEHATEVGHVNIHFQKLDGTHLGSFRISDYEKLLPPLP